MDSDSDISEFEGFSPSDIDDRDDPTFEIGSDISVSPVSTPETSENEESDEEEVRNDTWSENLRAFQIDQFVSPTGATFELGPLRTEKDFFLQFFPENLVERLVTETNNYAKHMAEERPDAKWTETNLTEMWAFLGIFMIFSIMQVPKYSIAWGSSAFFGITGLSEIMPRERFERLCKYFHVNDTTNNPARRQPGHDKLCHIRPILDTVLEKCLKNYNPPQNQSIDEGMIAYKGRLSFKQYLPAKPTKFGVKVWARAHPKTGYIHEFQIYVGKPEGQRGRVSEEGLGGRVIKDLTSSIKNKNHHIYMDNYFSSPKLFEDLLKDGIYCCGTVRSNRKGLPEKLKNTKQLNLRNQGDMKTMQKDTMICVAWKDRKIVHILFNNMDPRELGNVTRREKDGRRKEVRCPKVADTYSKNKGGVDIADQNRMQYSTCRKAKKWWKYIFWFLFDTAVCNSLICFRESKNHQKLTKSGKNKTVKQLDFRMNLAKQMISGYKGTRKRKSVVNIDIDGNRHWPGRFEKRGHCRQCSKEGRRHEVFLGCKECKVHLCADHDCFERYHTLLWQ